MRFVGLFALWITILLVADSVFAADLSSRERKMVETVNATLRRAGASYSAGNHDEAAKSVRAAMEQLDLAVRVGGPSVFDELEPAMKRIATARTMLELEGVSLPPFRKPERPAAKPAAETPAANPAQPGMTPDGKPTMGFFDPKGGISFTKQVAPILVGRCGGCHVQSSKGGFNTASYAALMKGPPEGVVVFAGDVIGSRLIETIETGDMPRGGGKVSPAELNVLKVWISEGARFDGPDPAAAITAAGAPAPAPMPNVPPPTAKKATGNETVSFASDVAPLLIENCVGCHIDAMQVRGGLRMDTFAQLLRGGDSGQIVTAGQGEQSLLVKKLRGTAADGDRMPAGRPPLSDDSIALISKWIDEGAAIDGPEAQPIKVMSQLAWASKATTEEMSARRAELADKNMQLIAMSNAQPQTEETEHFRVIGTGSSATLGAVAQAAEKHMKTVRDLVDGGAGADYFHGKATIFVLPKRYDYSEFAKMVEQRSIPTEWTGHWSFDGIDAYLAVVATDRDEEDEVSARVLGPLTSLAVATRGSDVPRWFAEGIGVNIGARGQATTRNEKQRQQAELVEAVGLLKNAKSFLENKMTAEHTDRVGAALAMTMLDRTRRSSLNAVLRALSAGEPFEVAFAKGFGGPPETYIENFRSWVQ
ncbi:c-type cytochrome domain-containing protein [Stieleria varia]|uniref:Planctomycete cytochrome C n=1 Tax=Stieleria varia TaxID=2528005 RepID=A0A5C6A031_9BACT|nr:c-type cytochrome domain-containing protein [Stieleria varia]TWT92755.1 Planctomycete cytochrome C [Stieleria varia]